MVRKPRRERKERQALPPPPPRGTSDRDKAVDALMALLAEHHDFQEIGLAEIAGRAGLKLSQLRAAFGSTLAIYAAHIKDIDAIVLGGGEDMTDEPPRERLFDVEMRRLEAMAPYKDAVRSMLHSARRSPPLALALNALALRSQRWMLEAAGINAAGPKGAMRAQGAALLFGRVLDVWLHDDDPALGRTMAALDRGLASAERWDGFIGDLMCIPRCILRGPRRHRHRHYRDEEPEAA